MKKSHKACLPSDIYFSFDYEGKGGSNATYERRTICTLWCIKLSQCTYKRSSQWAIFIIFQDLWLSLDNTVWWKTEKKEKVMFDDWIPDHISWDYMSRKTYKEEKAQAKFIRAENNFSIPLTATICHLLRKNPSLFRRKNLMISS